MLRRTKRSLPTSPTRYPAGTFVKTEKGYFYIVTPTKRYRITSERVLRSWSPQRVVPTTEAAVSKYKIAAKMKFRNGSLIWNLADAKLYLIENGKRRHVVSPDWFAVFGVEREKDKWRGIQIVSLDEINLHEAGEDLN